MTFSARASPRRASPQPPSTAPASAEQSSAGAARRIKRRPGMRRLQPEALPIQARRRFFRHQSAPASTAPAPASPAFFNTATIEIPSQLTVPHARPPPRQPGPPDAVAPHGRRGSEARLRIDAASTAKATLAAATLVAAAAVGTAPAATGVAAAGVAGHPHVLDVAGDGLDAVGEDRLDAVAIGSARSIGDGEAVLRRRRDLPEGADGELDVVDIPAVADDVREVRCPEDDLRVLLTLTGVVNSGGRFRPSPTTSRSRMDAVSRRASWPPRPVAAAAPHRRRARPSQSPSRRALR